MIVEGNQGTEVDFRIKGEKNVVETTMQLSSTDDPPVHRLDAALKS